MHMKIDKVKKQLRQFAEDRDWVQFHSPKNLSMALSAETGELLEHFQWLSEKDSYDLSDHKKLAVAEEIADIQIYLIRLADQLGIDLEKAVQNKIVVNETKYPAEQVKGSSQKYTEYK